MSEIEKRRKLELAIKDALIEHGGIVEDFRIYLTDGDASNAVMVELDRLAETILERKSLAAIA